MLHMLPLERPRSPLSPLKARGHHLALTCCKSKRNVTTASALDTKSVTVTKSALKSLKRLSSSTLQMLLLLPLCFLPHLFPLGSLLEVLTPQVLAPLPPCTTLTPSGVQTLGPCLI